MNRTGESLVDFHLLGPVEVWRDDQRLDLGRANVAKTRCFLAVLLRTPSELVSTEALIDRVWGERQPSREIRYKYVGWLRSALTPHGVELVQRDDGYVLNVLPDQVDLFRFRKLVRTAQAEADQQRWQEASGRLGVALEMWRGHPIEGLTGSWAELFRNQLGRERRDAAVLKFGLDLALGRPEQLVAKLSEWETENPLDEEIVGLLMAALYRAGRRDQALACFHRADARLHAALDCGAGAELRALYQRILNQSSPAGHDDGDKAGSSSLEAAAPTVWPGMLWDAIGGPSVRVPRQLPPAPACFAGRRAETAYLTGVLDRAQPARGATVIMAIHGQAGIGKTALAVSWAHQIADRFPDGQLFVNLRGHDGSPPVQPTEAVGDMLDALGVHPGYRPASPVALVGLLKSLLAERRILVLLDNASDVEQVRPLLPANSMSLVIVTSRSRLGRLVASEGAHGVAVELMTDEGARDLLSRHLGAAKLDAEPAAVEQLVASCGRLPLALAIVAARAKENPEFPLAALARDLADPSKRLAVLDEGEVVPRVSAAFAWSYEALTEDARRLFRLMSAHPGISCGQHVAASLVGISLERTRRALTELTGVHMLEQVAPGEYQCHDLLRSYAAGLSATADPPADRRLAIRRMLDHYVRTAASAAAVLNPVREPTELPPPRPGIWPEAFDEHDRALTWFMHHRSTLVNAVKLAATNGLDAQAGDLSWALADFLDRQGHWDDLALTQRLSHACADRIGNRKAQARASRLLGRAYTQLGIFDEAMDHYTRATDVCAQLGDTVGQALAHQNLADLRERCGDVRHALVHAEQALELYNRGDNELGRGRALNCVGWYRTLLGDHDDAVQLCGEALEISRRLYDRHGEADALDSLGHAYHHLADNTRSTRCYEQALSLYRQLGSRYAEALSLEYLAGPLAAQGDEASARHALNAAEAIFVQLAIPKAR